MKTQRKVRFNPVISEPPYFVFYSALTKQNYCLAQNIWCEYCGAELLLRVNVRYCYGKDHKKIQYVCMNDRLVGCDSIDMGEVRSTAEIVRSRYDLPPDAMPVAFQPLGKQGVRGNVAFFDAFHYSLTGEVKDHTKLAGRPEGSWVGTEIGDATPLPEPKPEDVLKLDYEIINPYKQPEPEVKSKKVTTQSTRYLKYLEEKKHEKARSEESTSDC